MAATTELAKIKSKDMVALDPNSDFNKSIASLKEVGELFDVNSLIRVKNPIGGYCKWTLPTKDGGEEQVDDIVGIPVQMIKSFVLWPTEGEAIPGTVPVLTSFDPLGLTGNLVGEIPDDMAEDMEPFLVKDKEGKLTGEVNIGEAGGFKYAQWGSANNGKGKRMKEQRRIYLLRPEDASPLVFTIQPGSLGTMKPWLSQVTNVASKPFWQTWLSLGLEKGKGAGGTEYTKTVMSYKGIVDEALATKLHDRWADQLREAVVRGPARQDG